MYIYKYMCPCYIMMCTIMSRLAHIMYNTPSDRNRMLRRVGFKILRVFPICMKRSIDQERCRHVLRYILTLGYIQKSTENQGFWLNNI